MNITQTVTYVPTVAREGDEVIVCTKIVGLSADRTDLTGYACTNEAIAKRLAAAIAAGVVFHDPEVGTDVYGRTYVHAPSNVLGRMMNADLERLGF